MYSSERHSVHRFSISRSSTRHLPERSWTVVAFPCFTVVETFTSWYCLLLLFCLRFSSVSLHCSPIQFSLPFFFLLFFFNAPSGSNHLGSGQVLWTCAGRNKTLPPSTSLPVTGEIAGVNTTSLGGRQGPDGRKRSTMNSTATCSTWREMAPSGCTLPVTHHVMKTSNHTISDRSLPGSTRIAPSTSTEV